MKIQNTGTTNYQKQQSFGALKYNAKSFDRLDGVLGISQLLEKYRWYNRYLNDGFSGRNVGNSPCRIFPTRKDSKAEKEIKQFVGADAESIGINEARKLRKNYFRYISDEHTKVEF